MLTEDLSLTVHPIGLMHSSMKYKFNAPHQPKTLPIEGDYIELFPGRGLDKALKDLEGFQRIWLIWWFHRNKSWRPLVLPPRGPAKRRGVFATRSPHRPNPIGISVVTLVAISELKIFVGESDLIDGTPILDIKPYIRSADAHPESRQGWLEDVEAQLSRQERFKVRVSELAAEQIGWLHESYGVSFLERAREILEQDPFPHRTRRIASWPGDLFRMCCGDWRLFFTVKEDVVSIQRIGTRFSVEYFSTLEEPLEDDRKVHKEYLERWPDR